MTENPNTLSRVTPVQAYGVLALGVLAAMVVLAATAAAVGLLLALLPTYPTVPLSWLAISFVYPAFYFALSGYLDVTSRQEEAGAKEHG